MTKRKVTMTLSLYGAKLTGCPEKEYYTSPNAYFEGQSAVVENFNPDIIFAPFTLTAEAEAFGAEVIYLKKNPPNLKKAPFNPGYDFDKLILPDINSHPRLCYIRESIKLLHSKFGKSTAIAGILSNPVDFPALLIGIDGWLETILFNPDQARKLMDKTSQFFISWGNALLNEGADFLILPSMFLNPRIVTTKLINNIFLPVLSEALDELNGPVVFHHGGNPIVNFLNIYKSLPNTNAFLIDSSESLAAAREILGKEKLLLGNVNGPNLFRFTPENISKICRKILEERRDDENFILATSGADVAYDTPAENISAFINSPADRMN